MCATVGYPKNDANSMLMGSAWHLWKCSTHKGTGQINQANHEDPK